LAALGLAKDKNEAIVIAKSMSQKPDLLEAFLVSDLAKDVPGIASQFSSNPLVGAIKSVREAQGGGGGDTPEVQEIATQLLRLRPNLTMQQALQLARESVNGGQ
jgi:hypothetical protein